MMLNLVSIYAIDMKIFDCLCTKGIFEYIQ